MINKNVWMIALLCFSQVFINAIAQEEKALSTSNVQESKLPKTLNILVETSGGQALFVANRYYLGGLDKEESDASTLNLKITTTFRLLGKSETIPLSKVKSFEFAKSKSGRNIGVFKVVTDNGEITDNSYQEEWPIKHYQENTWVALKSISGPAYVSRVGGSHGIVQSKTLNLNLQNLDGIRISFIDDARAQKIITTVKEGEAEIDSKNQKYLESQQKEAAKKEDEKRANIAVMAKATKGSEDSCKRIITNKTAIALDPPYATIECTFGGTVSVEDLKGAGWLVVNKTRDNDGVVTDYFIRKAR